MGRAPCCDKANVKKGPWSPEEDAKLKSYIEQHGTGGNWIALPQKIGLKRCGKSCRLRWLNYLRPNIKHGGFSEEEDNIICSLYINIGSRWSIIASQLPGRTDNDIKNYWNTRLKKKLFGKQRKEQQRSRVAAVGAAGSLNQEVKGADRGVGSLGITNNIGTDGLFAYWPQPPAASSMLPVVGGHVDVDQASASIRKLLSKLEGRFTGRRAADQYPLTQASSSSMPAQTILDGSTNLVLPMQCDKSPQAAPGPAPNLYSTELDEIFRFNSVKPEGLDYFQGIGGTGDESNESMNWSEVSPSTHPSNMISGYQGLMQHYCPFEEPVHLGVQ